MLKRRPRHIEEVYLGYLQAGREFAERVNRRLLRGRGRPAPAGFIGYDTGCLETLQMLSTRGVPTVVDQIDPGRTEEEIVLARRKSGRAGRPCPGASQRPITSTRSGVGRSDTSLGEFRLEPPALIRQGVSARKDRGRAALL